jgi:hypothetical protein
MDKHEVESTNGSVVVVAEKKNEQPATMPDATTCEEKLDVKADVTGTKPKTTHVDVVVATEDDGVQAQA